MKKHDLKDDYTLHLKTKKISLRLIFISIKKQPVNQAAFRIFEMSY